MTLKRVNIDSQAWVIEAHDREASASASPASAGQAVDRRAAGEGGGKSDLRVGAGRWPEKNDNFLPDWQERGIVFQND
jgi:hypothetical protein